MLISLMLIGCSNDPAPARKLKPGTSHFVTEFRTGPNWVKDGKLGTLTVASLNQAWMTDMTLDAAFTNIEVTVSVNELLFGKPWPNWVQRGLALRASDGYPHWFYANYDARTLSFAITPKDCKRLPRNLKVVESIVMWDEVDKEVITVPIE